VQAVIGVAGFVFHVVGDLRMTGASVFERTLGGPPPMAPLLFRNLVVLGWMALWDLAQKVAQR